MRILLIFNVFLLLISCNKEDSPPDASTNIPSAVEITVSQITSQSARVDWTISKSSAQTDIMYSVYLNDILLAEKVKDTFYDLINLHDATNYTIKIMAVNEYGTAETLQDFLTAQSISLRLKSYNQGSYNVVLNYNEDGQLIYRGDPGQYGYTNIDFTYNQNNEILTEQAHYKDAYSGPTTLLKYAYSNNTLDSLFIVVKEEDVRNDYNFQFNSPLNYDYVSVHEVFDGGPPEVYTNNYSVELELNGDDNIITYTRTNTDTSQMDLVHFGYENGNLTKIAVGNDVLEITYDNFHNWHTYRSGYMPNVYNYDTRDVGGFIYPPSLIGWLNQIPSFFDFKNTNNPIQYKYNGQVLTSFKYEYNTFDYPIKIMIPENNVTINLGYEAVE